MAGQKAKKKKIFFLPPHFRVAIGQAQMCDFIAQGNLLPLWHKHPEPGAESESILRMFELIHGHADDGLRVAIVMVLSCSYEEESKMENA